MRKPALFDNHPMPFVPVMVRGVCQYVVDGDTFDVMVDEGFYDYGYITVRLKDFDAPETRTTNLAEKAEGLKAKNYLYNLLVNRQIKLLTFKDTETFGRFVADVWYWENDTWKSVAEYMIANGFEKKPVY